MKIEDARVLVVDDDKVMLSFVVNLLSRLGVSDVRQATDGKAALLILADYKPDIVLSDIHMTPIGGIELVQRIRDHARADLRKTPVLIMSADSSTDRLNESVPLGIAGYIIKPPALSALKLKLEHALKFRSAALTSG